MPGILPRDGLVAVVKRDCPTCVMAAPILGDLAQLCPELPDRRLHLIHLAPQRGDVITRMRALDRQYLDALAHVQEVRGGRPERGRQQRDARDVVPDLVP